MKKLLLLLVIALYAADGNPELNRTQLLPEYVNGAQLAVFEIDGYEYLGLQNASNSSWFLTHKGNCKYCEKRNNKEQASSYTPPSTIQPYKSRYLDH